MGYYKQQMIDTLDSQDLEEPDPISRSQMQQELAEYDIEHMSLEELKEWAFFGLYDGYGKYSNHDLITRHTDLFDNRQQSCLNSVRRDK